MAKIILSLLLITSVSGILPAEESDFEINVYSGSNVVFGYTLYSIGWNFKDPAGNLYTIGYKLSELKFPLDCFFAFGKIDVRFLRDWIVGFGFGKSYFYLPGKMKDSDWGVHYLEGNTWASPGTLDIYSESDSTVKNAYSIDFESFFQYDILPGIKGRSGLGFIYEYYYFEVSNLDQWYPSYAEYGAYLPPSYSQHDIVSGLIGTYEVIYLIPLLLSKIQLHLPEGLVLDLMVGFSPFLKVFDADDHILRSKLSHGDSTGIAFKCVFDGKYFFTDNFYACFDLDFMYIFAKGMQSQMFYNDTPEGPAGPIGSIGTEIGSMRFSAGIHLGVSF